MQVHWLTKIVCNRKCFIKFAIIKALMTQVFYISKVYEGLTLSGTFSLKFFSLNNLKSRANEGWYSTDTFLRKLPTTETHTHQHNWYAAFSIRHSIAGHWKLYQFMKMILLFDTLVKWSLKIWSPNIWQPSLVAY